MAFPSTLSTLANPQPTDRLNSPSHSGLHRDENSAILEIERTIGTDASIIGTIIGDLRNPSSDGGGHVQTANRGGTGQVLYGKGDILVGQSSSVLTKLAPGVDGQVLKVNSSVATGVTWGTAGTKIAVSTSIVSVSSVMLETSVMSAIIPGSTLGTNGAVRTTLLVRNFQSNDNGNELHTIRVNYGTSSIAVFQFGSVFATSASISGKMEIDILANNTNTSQRGTVLLSMNRNTVGSVQGINFFGTALIAEDSSAPKQVGVTYQSNVAVPGNEFSSNGYIIEAIT